MSFAEADLLVLGASMLGIEFVHRMRRARSRIRTIVVDRQARHPYIPLCHERLTGRIPGAKSTVETAAWVGADRDATFVQEEIVAFDPAEHVASLSNGDRVRGRIVVIALGSRLAPPPQLPGHERLLSLKSARALAEADAALATTLHDATDPRPVLVVGGGISGVELAGELAHLRRERPAGWGHPAVTLVHAGDRLLPGLTPAAGRRAHALLERQGARVRLRTRVLALREDGAELEHEDATEWLPDVALAFWAGGLAPARIVEHLGLPTTRDGWLAVGPTLQCFPTPLPTDPELFAGGDLVRIQGGNGQWPTMQRAIECIWQAKTLARNVLVLLGEPEGYPNGVPPLRPHVLRTDFPHGVSVGARSLIVYGRAVTDPRSASVWFRRWLMRQYLDRYAV